MTQRNQIAGAFSRDRNPKTSNSEFGPLTGYSWLPLPIAVGQRMQQGPPVLGVIGRHRVGLLLTDQ